MIFNIVPQYALVTGLAYPKMKYFTSKPFNEDGMNYLDRGCDAEFDHYFHDADEKGVIGIDFLYCRSWEQDLIFRCVYMLVVGLCCWIYILCKEYNINIFAGCCGRQQKNWASHPSNIMDHEDLQNENTRMLQHQTTTDPNDGNADSLQLKTLSKGYNKKDKFSLERVNFGVKNGEIFGYLGANGAGKSTTLKILTGLQPPTSGGAFVNGIEIEGRNVVEARKNISYCSQTDNLFAKFTVEEHLRIFAMFHGYENIEETVDISITNLQLEKYRKIQSEQLSGGNKRKLMTALCLLSSSKVLLLDEPSSGMDPCAQRFLWNTIENVRTRGNSSIVLTSHSFPEIQALCDRVGILVEGKLRCIGPEFYVSSKYSRDYTVMLSFPVQPDLVTIDENMESITSNVAYDNSLITELQTTFGVGNITVLPLQKSGSLQLKINKMVKFSTVFGQLRAMKEEGKIDLFSIIDGDLGATFSQWIQNVAEESL
eukprot:Pgem_evm2s12606